MTDEVTIKDYPEKHPYAFHWFEYKSFKCTLLKQPGGNPCGYVRIPGFPVMEYFRNPAFHFVPVHGGLTFSERDETTDSVVFGFDCGHSMSQKFPCDDTKWLEKECRKMTNGLLALLETYPKYRMEPDRAERMNIMRDIFGANRNPEQLGIMGMMDLLLGAV